MVNIRTPDIGEDLNDPNRLQIDRIEINGVNVALVSCDHEPTKMPKEDPWRTIEGEIARSSLVFVEYFPPELERTVYSNPIIGKIVKNRGNTTGINPFFTKIELMCRYLNKEIAVADIANSLNYSAYYGLTREIGPISAALLGTGRISGSPEIIIPSTILALSMSIMGLQEAFKVGIFDLERKKLEQYYLDMEDARRLLTAKGIEQEAQRRKGGSQLVYISPRAHVSRVMWYLQNPQDLPSKIKGKIYSLATGLPRSTRIYKFDDKHQCWNLTSNVETRV